jgi:hypothetical protein
MDEWVWWLLLDEVFPSANKQSTNEATGTVISVRRSYFIRKYLEVGYNSALHTQIAADWCGLFGNSVLRTLPENFKHRLTKYHPWHLDTIMTIPRK